MNWFARSVFFAVATVVFVPSVTMASTFLDPATNLDIYRNSGGAAALDNPVLLILGIANDTSNSFASNPMTGVSPDLYTFLTPQQPTTTSFGVYVFATTNNKAPGAQGLVDIQFNTALPTGTFAFAFGQDSKKGLVDDTQFTDGLTGDNVTLTALPEPASLMLLGTGLLLAGRKFRKNRQMQKLRDLKSSKSRILIPLSAATTSRTTL